LAGCLRQSAIQLIDASFFSEERKSDYKKLIIDRAILFTA